ncbi:MAG: putative baseplate assembly protein [Caldilineaceae bacterium]|nr:putative baseplate assembly protein [Caldilineaceae bacterium]
MSDKQRQTACGCDERTPPEPSHTNRPGQPRVTYRLGTHGTLLRRMIARLSSQEIPAGEHEGERPLAALTTRATSDPTLAMLDAAATLGDVLTFYQERIANEGYLRTATERQSVLHLARAIGYELKPGVAASTYLAFILDDSAGAQSEVRIPAGTQVQSIPVARGELPQTFETSGELTARRAWNALKPRKTRPYNLTKGTRTLYVAGVDTRLQPGDFFLLVGERRRSFGGSERWDVRRVLTVTPVEGENGGYTIITWEPGLGSEKPPMDPAENPKLYAFRQRARRFGYNAPDWRTMPEDVKKEYASDPNNLPSQWPDFEIKASNKAILELDASYPKIVAGSWVALLIPGYVEIYQVKKAETVGVANFTLTGQVTRLELDSTEHLSWFERRETLVLAQSEELTLAEAPIDDPVTGKQIEVIGTVTDLAADQPIVVSGKLNEDDDTPTGTVVFVEQTKPGAGFTTIVLKDQGLGSKKYIRSTTSILANVVAATHGETTTEVLGSGDGSRPHQRFKLKKSPLTYVSAKTASGAASTLTVRVNDVAWEQEASLYGKEPSDHTYIVRIDDDSIATVTFGDGKQGARLPTGQENVTATYRFGIGSAGEVGAGSLTLLKTRPLGVRGVTNPTSASGAEDPETLDNARTNAPQTVLTLDRIVSLRDFEDFANAFAGVGKAQAVAIRDGEQLLIHITIADASGDPVEESSELFINLRDAIDDARDPAVTVMLASYKLLTFRLKATIQYESQYLESKVQAALETVLREQYAFEKRDFGEPVTAAELMESMHSVAGVVAVDLDELAYVKAPESGAVTLRRPFAGLGGLGGIRPQRAGSGVTALLPARTARREGKKLMPAQLLLLDEEGIDLTLTPVKG